MKTKIAYVLISDENDTYLQQLLISLTSLRLHNPKAIVLLAVDHRTYEYCKSCESLTKLTNDIIIVECPEDYSKIQRSRHIKTTLRQNIDGDYLFIDTDTIIVADLSEIDNFDMEIGAVLDKHILIKDHHLKNSIIDCGKKVGWVVEENDGYFNSGIIFVKDTSLTRQFYSNWNKGWTESLKSGIWVDQPSFNKSQKDTGLSIQEIDGMWNCQVIVNGIKYIATSKIIHYFGSQIDNIGETPYYFCDKKILNIVKQNNNKISEDLLTKIINAKSMFSQKSKIISGREFDFRYTTMYSRLLNIYISRPKLFKAFNKILSLFLKLDSIFINSRL